MIELRTLGGISLTDGKGREVRGLLAQSRRLALLAYLATASPRGFHRRDTLLALFWPDQDHEHARAALRQALHVIRSALGDGVVLTRGDDEVSLDWRVVRCDAAEFENALASDSAAAALDWYRGPLLAGFFISGAPEFERWMDAERTRYHQAAMRSVHELIDTRERNGDLASAVRWARRATELDGTDEVLARRLIALLDRTGDRAGAVAAYEAFARRLAASLEIEPSPETRSLLAAVRGRAEAGPGAGSSGAEAPSAASATSTAKPSTTEVTGPAAARQPVRSARRWRAALVLSGAMLIAGVLIARTRIGSRRADGSGGAEARPRVVIAPFANRTGDASFDPLGSLLADWIARELDATGLVQASFAYRDSARSSVAPTGANVSGLGNASVFTAGATGPVLVVSGTLYRRSGTLEFHARVSDARSGALLRTLAPVEGDTADPWMAVRAVRQRVLAYLAAALDPKLARWASRASQPPGYEAYREFVEGLHYWYEGLDARTALPRFLHAAALDSSFTLPAVWAAFAYRALNRCELTDSIGQALLARPEPLPQVDRALLGTELAICQGDMASAYRGALELADAAPGSEMMATFAARNALFLGRPREAIRRLVPLHPDRGELLGHTPYYLFLTTAYHQIDDHVNELAVARRARAQYPNNLATARMELVALAALGRLAEISPLLDEVASLALHPMRNPGVVIRETALELEEHGHPAEPVFARALDWFRRATQDSGSAMDYGFELAQTAFVAGRREEARARADSLLREHPDSVTYLGIAGALAAVRGDSVTARHRDSLLARVVERYLPGAVGYWRASIAAWLGDPGSAVNLLREAQAQGYFAFQTGRRTLPLHANPFFRPLRNDRRFLELARPAG